MAQASHDSSFLLCQTLAFQASLVTRCDPVLDDEKKKKSAGLHLGRIIFLDKKTGSLGQAFGPCPILPPGDAAYKGVMFGVVVGTLGP